MKKVEQETKIRKAILSDGEVLIELINALADYEKLERPNPEACERIKKDAFGLKPKINVWLAEVNSKAVAYAIYVFTYSSFLAKSNLFIEDIFVLPEYRSLGIGKALFKQLAKIALAEGCGRMDWQVLDWNKLAIDFYDKIGAKHLKEWYWYRLNENQLEELAQD